MGERHYRYIWYDGSSKQSGRGQTSISHIDLGSDFLSRICYEKKKVTQVINRVGRYGSHVDKAYFTSDKPRIGIPIQRLKRVCLVISFMEPPS